MSPALVTTTLITLTINVNRGSCLKLSCELCCLLTSSAKHVELPAKRTVKYLHLGHIDFDVISLEWLSQAEKQNPQFIYSDTLFTVDEYLVSLKNNVTNWQQLEAIKNQPVGTVLGYYYYDDNHFKRVDFSSEKQLIQALKLQRVEVVIIDKLPALYWAQAFNADISFGAYIHKVT